MNKYEGIFIIKPTLSEDDLKTFLGSIEEEIKKNKGNVDKVESWGRKKMSYSIKRFDEGLYYKIDFEVIPSVLKDMERKFHLGENIIRFMMIKKEK